MTPVAAQETRATLSGTMMDPSGSSVSGAKLHLVNVETGGDFSTETNQSGQYRFLFLNPGNYRLTAEMPGFRNYLREGIVLTVGQAATLDIALQLGAQADTITVGAEAPLLEARKGGPRHRGGAEKPGGIAHCHPHAAPDGGPGARRDRHQSEI